MGNLDTREGIESLPVIKSMIPWTEKIYDMTDEEIENYKSAFRDEYDNSKEEHTRAVIDVFYCEYQYYQVRKDYKWVQEQYALSGDRMTIRREILLQRLRGADRSPISPQDLEAIISNMKHHFDDLLINGKWRFLIYEHGQGYENGKLKLLDENIPYLIGVDPSGGEGGDNFAVCIVNPYNLRIAAEFKSPYMGLTPAVQMLVTLIEDYIPRGVIIPERNSMGTYLIQHIVDSTTIKDNLYWSEKAADKQLKELAEESPDDYRLKQLATQYKKYGTYNTPSVRHAMFEILFRHVNECKEILDGEYLVDDICKLERNPKTKKVAAVSGEHDDCLMAYLHTMYVYYNGDNIENFGIIKSVHPVLGPVQLDYEQRLAEREPGEFFSTDDVSFDSIAMRDAARQEEEIKILVDHFNFVHDDVYSKRRDKGEDDVLQGEYSISTAFFDMINGVYD